MGIEYQQYRKAAADRKKAILRLNKKGVSHKDIAAKIGVSRQRVHQIIQESQEQAK